MNTRKFTLMDSLPLGLVDYLGNREHESHKTCFLGPNNSSHLQMHVSCGDKIFTKV